MEGLDHHPGLRSSVHWGGRLGHIMSSRSLAVYLHYKLAQIDQDDADDFFNKLQTGVGLRDGDGALTLRRLLEREGRKKEKKYDDVDWHAFFIKAWNSYRTGRPLPMLQFKRGGRNPEQFPHPI
jgi:hypothetical protein